MAGLIYCLVTYLQVILICQQLQTSVCSECQGTDSHGYLNGRNIESFLGCSRVTGSLVINHTSLEGDLHTPPVRHNQLSYLLNIKEIGGYLLIENIPDSNFTSLRFLRNLEVVHGRETIQYRSGQEYSFVVQNIGNLQTMSLSSLQRIENGGIRISQNPLLCLVDTLAVEDILVSSTLRRIGGLGMDCSDYTCHEQCAPNKGCWGTLVDECVECRNYKYLGTCVESCDMNVSHANDTSRECLLLTPVTTQMTVPTTSEASLSTTAPAMMNNDHERTVSSPEKILTTHPENATNLANDSVEERVTIWATGAVLIGGVVIIIFSCILTSYFYHRWKKTQKINLIKSNLKEGEFIENACAPDMLSRNNSFPNHSERSSSQIKANGVSISGLNAQSYHHYHQNIINGHVFHYQNNEIDSAGVHESCDYPPDHVTLKCIDQASHFHSSNSVGTHKNICVDFQNNSLNQTVERDLLSRNDTTPLLSLKQTLNMNTTRRTSDNTPSSTFTPKESYFTTPLNRPMTGGVYSTRTSPPLHTTSFRPSLTSLHGTRTPSRLTPSHRESLTSSHGGSISRASTMTSRMSNSRSIGGSGRIVVSVHGSDPSLSGELMEKNG